MLGVGAGLGIALLAVQFLRGLLYEVSPADPLAFAGAGILLGLAALVATYVPARSTARVDPVEVLGAQ